MCYDHNMKRAEDCMFLRARDNKYVCKDQKECNKPSKAAAARRAQYPPPTRRSQPQHYRGDFRLNSSSFGNAVVPMHNTAIPEVQSSTFQAAQASSSSSSFSPSFGNAVVPMHNTAAVVPTIDNLSPPTAILEVQPSTFQAAQTPTSPFSNVVQCFLGTSFGSFGVNACATNTTLPVLGVSANISSGVSATISPSAGVSATVTEDETIFFGSVNLHSEVQPAAQVSPSTTNYEPGSSFLGPDLSLAAPAAETSICTSRDSVSPAVMASLV